MHKTLSVVAVLLLVGRAAIVWGEHSQVEADKRKVALPEVYASADIPSITLSAGTVDLGIRYTLSGQTKQTSEFSSEFKSVTSSGQTHNITRTDSRTVKRKVTQSLKGGFDLAKGLKAAAQAVPGGKPSESGLSATANLTDYFEEVNGSAIQETFTSSTSATTSAQVASLNKRMEERQVVWGPNDGFIRSQITLTSTSQEPVTIKDIYYDIVEVDPCGSAGKRSNSLGSGYLLEANLTAATPQDVHLSTSDTRPPSKLTIDLPSGDNQYSRQLYIPNLSTDMVVRVLAKPRLVEIKIVSFKFVQNGKERVYSQNPVGYITVDLLGPRGQYSQIFVKASKPLMLREILQLVGPGEVKTRQVNGRTIIDSFAGVESAFSKWDPGSDSSEQAGEKGLWLVTSISRGMSADIVGAVPPGARLLVVYITLSDLRLANATPTVVQIEVPSSAAQAAKFASAKEVQQSINQFGGNQDLVPLSCVGGVSRGDEVGITLGSLSERYTLETQDWTSVPFEAQIGPHALAQACNAHYDHFKKREQHVVPSSGLDPYHLEITFDPADPFKQSIPLQQVVPLCGFEILKDGRVRFAFTITDEMLPEGSGNLCFVTPITKVEGVVGRKVKDIALPIGTLAAAAADVVRQACGRWKALDPPRPETVYNYNKHHIEVTLTHATQQ